MKKKELITVVKREYKTVSRFCRKTNLDPNRIRRFLNGNLKRGLDAFEFIRLSDELHISPEEYCLFFGSQIPGDLMD